MITAAPHPLQAPVEQTRVRKFSFVLSWPHAIVAALAGVSLFLGLSNITSQGFANYYYAAAVRSMMQNWHAFYFVSLDSKGFVSIDKPPLGFWVQTISALLFGYHGWSLLLPEAIAGAGSVILVYAIVNRFFGAASGLIAALAMTISPINIAVARNNTPDGLLVFTLLAAALCFSIAIQRGRMVWLVAAFALVGIGFNIKMMEAYLILPGMVVAYLLASHSTIWRRIGHLSLASIVLAIVSFSWATTVWLTPANQRPYVGSTKNNNIFSLIFGYNGINRLLPKGWSIFGITNGSVATSEVTARSAPPTSRAGENGPQGLFRLFDHQLGGQIGWLIPLALIGLLAAWGLPRRRRLDGRHSMLLMFGIWALVEIAFFSEAGFYHRYYLATLSPSIAILAGIGVVTIWRQFRAAGWSAILLPLTLAATVAMQFHILAIYPFWKSRLGPILIGSLVATAIALVAVMAVRRLPRIQSSKYAAALSLFAAMCLLTTFAAPGVWSYSTIQRGYEGALPIAGPNAQSLSSTAHAKSASQSASIEAVTHAKLAAKPLSSRKKSSTDDPGRVIMAFLNAHRSGTEFVVAVPSSREADPIIVNTGEPVMALGGFWGSDPILSVDALRGMIKSKEIRFFLIQGNDASLAANLAALTSKSRGTSFGSRTLSQQTVSMWVETTCPLVPPSTIAASTPGATTTGLTGIYDCKGKGA